MRKIILVSLLSLICSIDIVGQIQRKFFGLNLGVATRQEVINVFKAKQKKIWLPGDDHFSVRDISFGGNRWPVVYFYFYNNQLYLIYFSDTDRFSDVNTLNAVWERLDVSLSSKYKDYYDDKQSTLYKKVFNDNRTRLNFDYKYVDGIKGITLKYTDIRLLYEMFMNEEDEL